MTKKRGGTIFLVLACTLAEWFLVDFWCFLVDFGVFGLILVFFGGRIDEVARCFVFCYWVGGRLPAAELEITAGI